MLSFVKVILPDELVFLTFVTSPRFNRRGAFRLKAWLSAFTHPDPSKNSRSRA